MKVRIICKPPVPEQQADVHRVTVSPEGRLQLVAFLDGREMVCSEFAAGEWVAWAFDEPDRTTRLISDPYEPRKGEPEA